VSEEADTKEDNQSDL
jgi:hypothetical protein